MLNAEAIYNLDREDRKRAIEEAAQITEWDDDLTVASKISAAVNTFIIDYFEILIAEDNARFDGSILTEKNFINEVQNQIQLFWPYAVRAIEEAFPAPYSAPKNIYELAGARKLSAANNVTRKLSTTMGLLWERIANISPYAINPEMEFGIKIKGVDLISRHIGTGIVEYQQLKTQKNTLTGSQQPRSVSELSIHDYPVFCACFPLSSWTFNCSHIPRVAGVEFWSRIGIDYYCFESCVMPMIQQLDIEYGNI